MKHGSKQRVVNIFLFCLPVTDYVCLQIIFAQYLWCLQKNGGVLVRSKHYLLLKNRVLNLFLKKKLLVHCSEVVDKSQHKSIWAGSKEQTKEMKSGWNFVTFGCLSVVEPACANAVPVVAKVK